MTVKELIEELQKFEPNREVIVWTDGSLCKQEVTGVWEDFHGELQISIDG